MKMKIQKSGNRYFDPITVSYIPSKFERFFGFRESEEQFADSGSEYLVGGTKWLNYPDMTVYGSIEKLDAFVRRSKNEKDYSETNDCVREYFLAILYLSGSFLSAVLSWLCFFRIHIDKGPWFTAVYVIVGISLGLLTLALLRKAVILLIKGYL